MDSLLRRLLAGLGLSGAIIIVTMIAQIILVPVLLTTWGDSVYGEWLVLTTLASSLSIMNFGVQSYVCNLLIACYVKGEIGEGTRILHSALSLYTIFTVVAVLIVVILGISPGLLNWLNIEQIPAPHGHLILIIYGSLAAYAIFGGLLLSLFQVSKQMPRQLTYGLFERVIILCSPMLVAWFGGPPVAAAIATALLLCALIVVELRDVWRQSPFVIGLSQADRLLAISFIKPGLTFFAVSLAALMVSTGVVVLLSSQEGGQAVALFSTTLLLVNFVRTIVNQGLNVFWPEITGAAALADDPQRLPRWYLLLLKATGAFVLICVVGISLLGADVLAFWTRGRIEVDLLLNLLLAVYLAVQAPVMVSSVFGLALNRQSDLLKVQMTTGVVTLGLGTVFINFYGVNGAAAALIVGQVVVIIWFLKLTCVWTNTSWTDFLWKTLPRFALGFSLVMLITFRVSLSSLGLPERLFCTLVLTVVVAVMFWQYWLITAEKKLLRTATVYLTKGRYG